MRCVLDTNIVLSGFLWNGSPHHLWTAVQQGAVELFTSEALRDELQDVLSRPKCAKRLCEIGLTAVELLNLYATVASLIEPATVTRLAPDPDDDVVIATAIAAKADFIVTGDKPLLSVEVFEGGRIVSVGEALEAIAQSASQRD
ncbi:MAG: putative toxin-antitoxin system toxin component, PIN family [Terracidiphilus sp.]